MISIINIMDSCIHTMTLSKGKSFTVPTDHTLQTHFFRIIQVQQGLILSITTALRFMSQKA